MIDAGIEAYIVSCNEKMGQKFLGERITTDLIRKLDQIGVDACGRTQAIFRLLNYFLYSILVTRQTNSPAPVFTIASSPTSFFISARAIGESIEM